MVKELPTSLLCTSLSTKGTELEQICILSLSDCPTDSLAVAWDSRIVC